MDKKKLELKEEFDKKFKELEDLINSKNDLDGRSKSVAITNLQTAKMWAVRAIFEN